ncbi:MAG: hypothetical protein JW827_08715 [Spirochaetes bacterium]|nr:hypothetical protein [Spirochaetota bacterium]
MKFHLMKNIAIIAIIVSFLFLQCERTPNPFAHSSEKPEPVHQIYVTRVDRNGGTELDVVIYQYQYDFTFIEDVFVKSKWYSSPMDYEDAKILYDMHYEIRGNEIKGIRLRDNDGTPGTAGDPNPPNIMSISGPRGDGVAYQSTLLPEITLDINDPPFSEGISYTRGYKIQVGNVYGNYSEPIEVLKDIVKCRAVFIPGNPTSWQGGQTGGVEKWINAGEYVEDLGGNAHRIRLVFDPVEFSSWYEISPLWIMKQVEVYDNANNGPAMDYLDPTARYFTTTEEAVYFNVANEYEDQEE